MGDKGGNYGHGNVNVKDTNEGCAASNNISNGGSDNLLGSVC